MSFVTGSDVKSRADIRKELKNERGICKESQPLDIQTQKYLDELAVKEELLKGYSADEIAKNLSLASEYVETMLKRISERCRQQILADKTDIRNVEVMRIDKYLTHLSPKIEEGSCSAVGVALKAGGYKSKLLGLDAPTETTIRIEQVHEFISITINTVIAVIDECVHDSALADRIKQSISDRLALVSDGEGVHTQGEGGV